MVTAILTWVMLRVRHWLAVSWLAVVGLVLAPSLAGAQPAPSASAGQPAPAAHRAEVRLKDTLITELRAPLAGVDPGARARAATRAIEAAFDEGALELRTERRDDIITLYAGAVPVLQLGAADAAAAGNASLEDHANAVATNVRKAIRAEQRRADIAKTVFGVSLTVFFGLVALYLLRKVGDFSDRGRDWVTSHPGKIPGISVQSIEVVRPATLRSAVLVAVTVGRWLGQFGVAWLYLLFSLSLFERTRGISEHLSGAIIAPFSQFTGRIATSLPVVLVVLLAGLVVVLTVRFLALFFASVARGEVELRWLPADLAAPTSALVRAAVVVVALVFLAPVVTGDTDGALVRVGTVSVIAFALAATPALASVLVGMVLVFGRRLQVGSYVELGPKAGRVKALTLADVELEAEDGSLLRVPHLLALVQPARVHGKQRPVAVEVSLAAPERLDEARALLTDVAGRYGAGAKVELVGFDASSVRLRLSVSSDLKSVEAQLTLGVFEALRRSGLPLSERRG